MDDTKLVSHYQKIRHLTADDFRLSSTDLITLKCSENMMVLFYDDCEESAKASRIWAKAASRVAGPFFAACDLSTENHILKNFECLRSNIKHPFYWAKIKQKPFVLIYDKGSPQEFYKNRFSVQQISSYALTLSCANCKSEL